MVWRSPRNPPVPLQKMSWKNALKLLMQLSSSDSCLEIIGNPAIPLPPIWAGDAIGDVYLFNPERLNAYIHMNQKQTKRILSYLIVFIKGGRCFNNFNQLTGAERRK